MTDTAEKLRQLLTVVADLEAEGIEVIAAEASRARPATVHTFRPPAEFAARGTKREADENDEYDRYSYIDRGAEVFWLVPKPAADNNTNEAQS